MAYAITIEVPELIADQYPSASELKQNVFEDMVVREFQKGILTIRESAQLLGLTYEGFLEWLGERKISFITANAEDIEESYQEFEAFLLTYQRP